MLNAYAHANASAKCKLNTRVLHKITIIGGTPPRLILG